MFIQAPFTSHFRFRLKLKVSLKTQFFVRKYTYEPEIQVSILKFEFTYYNRRQTNFTEIFFTLTFKFPKKEKRETNHSLLVLHGDRTLTTDSSRKSFFRLSDHSNKLVLRIIEGRNHIAFSVHIRLLFQQINQMRSGRKTNSWTRT